MTRDATFPEAAAGDGPFGMDADFGGLGQLLGGEGMGGAFGGAGALFLV